MTMRAASVLVVLCLNPFSGMAYAQAPAPPPPPPLREGSADFSFVGTTGNSSTQTIGLGGEYIYRPSPWETKLKVNYVRNESEDELKAQAVLLTFRAQRSLRPRLWAYGQYGYQRDRFAGIINRNVVEAGLAYTWVEQARHRLIVNAGPGYANEQRLLGNNLSNATFGTGGLYRLKISDTSELSEDSYLVFSLAEGSDWRYANALALTAKMTTVFSLKASHTLRYVHVPTAGFKNTDAVTAIALVTKF